MSKISESAQSYWDDRSELFANYYKKPSLFDSIFRKGVYERVAVAVKACSELSSPAVLDIGSGPGLNAVSLIKNANSAHVTGIDFAQQMIDFAEKTATAEGVSDKCEFVLGDALTYDFARKKYNFSMALGVFDYIEHADALIKRMAELTTDQFVISWPENGLRMWLRRQRYTCPLYHYTIDQIKDLHSSVGISHDMLKVVRIGGGWVTVAKK